MEKSKKNISILIMLVLLFSVFATGFTGAFPSHNNQILVDNDTINLKGYAYNPSDENEFDLIGDVSLAINTETNTGKLTSGKEVFELDFELDKKHVDRVDYIGKAKNNETESILLLSVVDGEKVQVFGLIKGQFAFNAGNTIGHTDLKQQLTAGIESSDDEITTMNQTLSSDSYIADQGSKNSVYAQLLRPSSHSHDTIRDYGIRINTLYNSSQSLRKVRYFNAEGEVTNATLRGIDPSGYKKMPTDWTYDLLYAVAGFVGVSVNGSEDYYYDGSKYYGNFDLSVGTYSNWTNFEYQSNSATNGSPFNLWIENSHNRKPSITVHTSLDIYETLTGYLTITGPTLNY